MIFFTELMPLLLLLSIFLFLQQHLAECQVVDFSRVPKKIGPEVIRNVIAQIQASNIFPDDRLFMKRCASIYPLIMWQITQEMFDKTKNNFQKQFPALYSEVEKLFGIKWSDVTFADLDKPLYNGLAGRILIHLSYPVILSSQASQQDIYKKIFNRDTQYSLFDPNAHHAPNQCFDYVNIVILVDGSNLGSDQNNFASFSKLTKVITDNLHHSIGQADQNSHFSVVQFSDKINEVIKMDSDNPSKRYDLTFDNKAVRNTHEALAYLLNEGSFVNQEERLKPRVALLMTTGKSSNPEKTKEQLKRVLDAGISVIIVTVGEPFEAVDMNAPILLRNIVWADYGDADNSAYEIFDKICDAPALIKPDNKSVKRSLYDNENAKCLIDASNAETSVELQADEHSELTFYLSQSPAIFPSPVYYEKNVTVEDGKKIAEIFVKKVDFNMVPCSIQIRKKTAGYDVMRVVIKSSIINPPSACYSNPCMNGGTCTETGQSFKCTCTELFTGDKCQTKKNGGSSTGPMLNNLSMLSITMVVVLRLW